MFILLFVRKVVVYLLGYVSQRQEWRYCSKVSKELVLPQHVARFEQILDFFGFAREEEVTSIVEAFTIESSIDRETVWVVRGKCKTAVVLLYCASIVNDDTFVFGGNCRSMLEEIFPQHIIDCTKENRGGWLCAHLNQLLTNEQVTITIHRCTHRKATQ